MGSLIQPVRKAGKSGNYVYAVLEALTLGRAAVRLKGSSRRLTYLAVMSDNLQVGETVIVDYSSGVPPFVRGRGEDEEVEEEDTIIIGEEATKADEVEFDDISASIVGSSPQNITKDDSYKLQFDTVVWDEESMFDSPSHFELPSPGVYYVTVQVVLDNITCSYDFRNRIHGSIVGEEYGVFGRAIARHSQHNPSYPVTLSIHGVITGDTGERVSCNIWLDDEFGQGSVDIVYDGVPDAGYESYATASPAIQIFKIGGGFFANNMYIQEFSGQEDPPRIELNSNEGLLYLGESDDYVRAIASAQQQSDAILTCDFQFQHVESGESYLSFYVRSSTDWGTDRSPTSGIELRICSRGGWGVYVIDSGSSTLLASYNSPATALWQKLKFEVNGTTIRAKVWVSGESEPSWEISETDSSVPGPGGFQLAYWNVSDPGWARLDDILLETP